MNSSNSVRGSVSYVAGELDDPNGVKTTIATVAAPVIFAAADFNGAMVKSSGTKWVNNLPRSISLSRSDAVASYTTDDIIVTGKRGGEDVTETLTPADADGDDIIRGTQLFDAPPTIAIPAQVDTSGAWLVGVGDIGCSKSSPFSGVKLRAAGQINVQYGEDATNAPTDTFAALADTLEPIAPTRLLTDPALTTPTVVAATLYL